ncbi:MAG: DUF6600 domain-containing protein [Syntrophorhabdales bacterium]
MMKRLVQSMVFLIVAAGLALPSPAADAPPVVVGRVTDVETDLLRYVPEENDWVAAIRDVPFAAGDTFYSGNEGRAELMAPNGSRVRIGSATQIQFIALDPDFAETDVAAGAARLYNNGRDMVIRADSPFGYVLSYPGSVFDFYVGENSVEVVAVKGTVSFVHTDTNARYDVSAGSPSILADRNEVASGEGTVDPDWDAWNTNRDRFWAAKSRLRGPSAGYLPLALRSDAYVLEENGRWVRVVYEGRECWFWRPTTVAAGWAPFTVGRWTEWYGDQTWIPAEPFGYVTHHYGAWVLVGTRWYWAPPVARPGLPLLDVGFAWYPGRVSWIQRDGYVGWVPLAPRETYYCHYAWGGPRAVVVTDINIGRFNVNVRNYAYARHAVIVSRNNFYGVNNYRNVQVTNANINNYRAAPVINNTVTDNYPNMRRRYNYSNVTVNEKPHASVVNRIRQNEKIIHEGRKENPVALSQQAKNIRKGSVNQEARVQQPKMTNYILPAAQVNRPRSEVTFQQREVKSAGQGAGVRPGPQGQPGRPGGFGSAPPSPRPMEQTERPQGMPPAPPQQGNIPAQQAGPPTPKPQAVAPAQQAAPPTPRPQPQGMGPARPGQGAPPGTAQVGVPESRPPSPRPMQQTEKLQGTPLALPQQGNIPAQQAGPPTPKPQAVAPAQQAAPATPRPQPQGMAPARPGQGAPPGQPQKPAQPGEKKPQDAKQKEEQEKPQ